MYPLLRFIAHRSKAGFNQFLQLLAPFFFTRIFLTKHFFKLCNMKGLNQFFRFFAPALLLAAQSQFLAAQCISGNCQNGTGTYRYSTNVSYTGRFVNGIREGKGKMTLQNGNVYEGNFSRGRMSGDGVMTYNNGERYTGQWVNDVPNGTGKYFFKGRERYEGNFTNGEFDGQGTMYYPDGAYYTGGWKQNRKHGAGRLHYTDGTVNQGTWALGKLVSNTSATAQNQTNNTKVKPTPTTKPSKTKPDVAGMRNCGPVRCNSGKG